MHSALHCRACLKIPRHVHKSLCNYLRLIDWLLRYDYLTYYVFYSKQLLSDMPFTIIMSTIGVHFWVQHRSGQLSTLSNCIHISTVKSHSRWKLQAFFLKQRLCNSVTKLKNVGQQCSDNNITTGYLLIA